MTGNEPSMIDTGLLSPVRAGMTVEAAVSDHAWFQAMLDAEAALARAQARLGTLPAPAAEVITRTARADAFDVRALAVASRESANPVVGMVQALTRAVAEADPSAAEYVHRGSTSQDIMDTGGMLVARRALEIIRGHLAEAAAALAELARAHRDTAMAGRTLALHAVPTTFGLKAAGWRKLLLDADARIARLLNDGLPVSLGGAAGTLGAYLEYATIDAGSGPAGGDSAPAAQAGAGSGTGSVPYADRLVDAYAAETGLARPTLPWHALRTPIADLAAVLAFTSGALGKLAVDVLTLARTEVAEVVEPTAAGRGASSAMPHKRNPVLATLIRSAALQVPVLATGLSQALLAEDERSAGGWHAEWSLLRECLRLTGGAAQTAAMLAAGLQVRPEKMRANLELTGGQMTTERINAVLAPRLGRATVRALLTEASIEADRSGRTLAEVLADNPAVKEVLSPDELADLCDPTRYVGAAGHLVDRALER